MFFGLDTSVGFSTKDFLKLLDKTLAPEELLRRAFFKGKDGKTLYISKKSKPGLLFSKEKVNFATILPGYSNLMDLLSAQNSNYLCFQLLISVLNLNILPPISNLIFFKKAHPPPAVTLFWKNTYKNN